MGCAPSEDSDQPGHPPSLIRDFAVLMKKVLVFSYQLIAQRRLWSDWADAQADLSSLGAHSFCWFCHVVTQLFCCYCVSTYNISLGSLRHRMKKPWVLSYPLRTERKLKSDWAASWPRKAQIEKYYFPLGLTSISFFDWHYNIMQ